MKKRVLVISSANIDFVQNIERVPYSGETIVEGKGNYTYIPGGKGANSAIAFARIGAECVFACKVGADSNGEKLKSLYQKEGIDTRFIVEDCDNPTGLASILVENGGKNRIIVFPGANGTMDGYDIEGAFNCYPDALFVQFEIPDDAVISACRMANHADIPVFVDAAPARFDFPLKSLGKVEIFSPNETECRIFTGISPTNEETALRAAVRLRSLVDAKYIVIKMGEHGAFMFDGSEYFTYPSENVIPVDTTAAGDVFTAVMTYSYIQNGNIHSAIRMANVAAAISVTRAGASTSIPTLEEVLQYRDNVQSRQKNTAEENSPSFYSANDENHDKGDSEW